MRSLIAQRLQRVIKRLRRTYHTLILLLSLIGCTHTWASEEPKIFDGIVALHNAFRSEYQQVPLTWSPVLAQHAQQWVDNLAENKHCEMIHRPYRSDSSDQESYGENLFWASPEILADGQHKRQAINATEVFNAWAEEELFYNYDNNSCLPGKECGHYTQVIWHESRQIGCAVAFCPDQSQIWACNYYPRGNYIGERPY